MILFGLQSCGKTYFGRKLAEHLSLPFFDTDLLIEEEVGYSYRTFWAEDKKKYREVEKNVVLKLPRYLCVIATGGGTLLDPSNRIHLQGLASLIYLKTEKRGIQKQERLPIFESLLAKWIEIDGKTDEEVLWEATH